MQNTKDGNRKASEKKSDLREIKFEAETEEGSNEESGDESESVCDDGSDSECKEATSSNCCWCCPTIPDADDAKKAPMWCGESELTVGKLDSIATYLFVVHMVTEITTYIMRLYISYVDDSQMFTILTCVQFGINAACFATLGFAFNKLSIRVKDPGDPDSKKVQYYMIAIPITAICMLSVIDFAIDPKNFTALAQFGVDSCGYSFLTLVWYVNLTDMLETPEARIMHGRRRTAMFAMFLFFSIFIVVANVVHESDSHIAEDTLKYLYSVTEVILLFEIMHLVIESTMEARKSMHEAHNLLPKTRKRKSNGKKKHAATGVVDTEAGTGELKNKAARKGLSKPKSTNTLLNESLLKGSHMV